MPVPHRYFQANSCLPDENSGGRQPADEFDNPPGTGGLIADAPSAIPQGRGAKRRVIS